MILYLCICTPLCIHLCIPLYSSTFLSLTLSLALSLALFPARPPSSRYTMCFFCGVLPFVPIEEEIYGLKMGKISLTMVQKVAALRGLPKPVLKAIAAVAEKLMRASAGAIARHLARRGVPTWMLDINDDDTLGAAERAGATAFLTDRPEWLAGQRPNERVVPLPRQ